MTLVPGRGHHHTHWGSSQGAERLYLPSFVQPKWIVLVALREASNEPYGRADHPGG